MSRGTIMFKVVPVSNPPVNSQKTVRINWTFRPTHRKSSIITAKKKQKHNTLYFTTILCNVLIIFSILYCIFFNTDDMRRKSVNEHSKRRWSIEKLRSNVRNGEHLSRDFSELKDFIPKVTFFFSWLLDSVQGGISSWWRWRGKIAPVGRRVREMILSLKNLGVRILLMIHCVPTIRCMFVPWLSTGPRRTPPSLAWMPGCLSRRGTSSRLWTRMMLSGGRPGKSLTWVPVLA